MEYVIIGACIVVAIAGGIVLYIKNKRTKNELGNTAVVVSKTSSSKLQASEVANDLVIQIGILPADAISDETKLVEITDSKVLAHINNLVPGLAQAGNAANNATQAVKANGEVLYRAIIPAGAKLTDSKAMEGAVRGFYHGADGIRGHANLVAVEAQKGTAVAANTAAAAMGVASMIAVGFKVNSERAVQFRKWVNQIAKDYTIKGWVMDDERLKRGTYLTEKYFDEQLERMLNCSHRLRWPRSGYGCQFCHRLHLAAAVNMRFQNVWTCFRFDRICFREREQNLTSIRRYRAISRRLFFFPNRSQMTR